MMPTDVEPPQPPQQDGWARPRLASLVPSLTELLFALDLGPHVVARTGFCVHPREGVKGVPKVGGTKDFDIDALLATKPTHLVVNVDENPKEAIAALARAIPTVVVTHPLTPDDNLALFRDFGQLFDRHMQAAALTAAYQRERAALEATIRNAPPRKVLYLVWKKPWFTVARDTYVSAMLRQANLHTLPAVSTDRYPTLPDDAPAWDEAECILLCTEPYAFLERDAFELRARWAGRKPVLLADGEMLGWYGNRAIAGLRYLGELRAAVDRS